MAGQVLQDIWEMYQLPLLTRCSSCTIGKYTFFGQLETPNNCLQQHRSSFRNLASSQPGQVDG